MAEVFKRRIIPQNLRGVRKKDTKTTIKSKLGEDDPKELRSTDVQERGRKTPTVESFKKQETAWPYKGPDFADKPEAKSGIKKGPKARKITSAKDQPISKRRITAPSVGVPKKKGPDKFAPKTTTQQWGSDFSKWLRSAKADVEKGVSKATKEVGDWSGALPSSFSVNELWDKFAKQSDGEVPKKPPASAKKKLNKVVTNARKSVTTSGEPTTKPKEKFTEAEKDQFKVAKIKKPVKKVAKKVATKVKPTNVNTGDAASIPSDVKRKEWGNKSQNDLYNEAQAAKAGEKYGKKEVLPKIKKAAAPSEVQIDKGGAFGPKDEETADFKDFLSKRGGVKGFQFNLVGKNKTKEAGMKRAREAYAEEQRDRKRPGQSDHYQYGEGRRAVKKKGGPMRAKHGRVIKKTYNTGGTIRLKSGGAVIDTYDY
jgi:hypothetical protein